MCEEYTAQVQTSKMFSFFLIFRKTENKTDRREIPIHNQSYYQQKLTEVEAQKMFNDKKKVRNRILA